MPQRPLIERMDAWLAANRADYRAALQPGVGDDELDAFEARFSLKLPEAALYRWRNGQPNSSFDSLQDNRMFSALEDIADTKEMLDDMIGSDFEDPATWRRGWVPFLSNGGGSYLCVDIDAEGGGRSRTAWPRASDAAASRGSSSPSGRRTKTAPSSMRRSRRGSRTSWLPWKPAPSSSTEEGATP